MNDCPTPGKQAYPSRGYAKAEAKRATQRHSLHGQLRPYRCDCGAWHLTHLSGAERRAARRRRRAAAARAAA